MREPAPASRGSRAPRTGEKWSTYSPRSGNPGRNLRLATPFKRHALVKVQNENTAAPLGEPQFIGWCLDKEDLCVAKLCALREKDQNFVDALPNWLRR